MTARNPVCRERISRAIAEKRIWLCPELNNISEFVAEAQELAIHAHGKQVKKYDHEPYANHVVRVAKILQEIDAPDVVAKDTI